MPLTPTNYLENTINLFGQKALALIVTPVKGSAEWQASIRGAEGANPGEALEMLAAASVMLERQLTVAIAAAAEAIDKSHDEVLDIYRQLVERQTELTDQNHEAQATAVKRPRLMLARPGGSCTCAKPALPHAGMVAPEMADVCRRCGKRVGKVGEN